MVNSNPPITSPRSTYRSTTDVLGQDGATLVGITDIAIKSSSKKAVESGGPQSHVKLPPATASESNASNQKLRQNSHNSTGLMNVGEYGAGSTRTLKTTTQWYLKSPAKNSTFYDQAYKVVPTLNHAQRVNKLDQITKENKKLFLRIQGVKSDYDATKLLQKTN